MKKRVLFIYYLKDIYALRFHVERTRIKSPDLEIVFLLRQELRDRIHNLYPQTKAIFFLEKGKGRLQRALSLFDFVAFREIKACRPQKLIFLFHTNFGIVAILFRCLLFILGIPEIEFVDISGRSYTIQRGRLIIDAFKKQFPKAVLYYWLSRLSLMLKLKRSLGKPVSLTIEPVNICNLRCPICRTGVNKSPRDQGVMTFETFKIVIDKLGYHTNNILLYGFGEPFLNKDIYRMIDYAKNKNIYISICTNGLSLNLEKIVHSRLDNISFAIGGLTQETHEVYRKGSQLNRVLENMRNLVTLKKEFKKDNPKIILDFVVQKHNESQRDKILELALDMEVDGVYFIPTIVWDIQQAKEFLPQDEDFARYDTKLLEQGIIRQKLLERKKCASIWFSFIIQWNGIISPCCGLELPMIKDSIESATDNLEWNYCVDYYPLGDILNGDSLFSIWNGKKFTNLRRRVLKNIEGVSICRLCSGYDAPNLR